MRWNGRQNKEREAEQRDEGESQEEVRGERAKLDRRSSKIADDFWSKSELAGGCDPTLSSHSVPPLQQKKKKKK